MDIIQILKEVRMIYYIHLSSQCVNFTHASLIILNYF